MQHKSLFTSLQKKSLVKSWAKTAHKRDKEKEAIDVLKRHDALYDAEQEIITDEDYDALREAARKSYPNNPYYKTLGPGTSATRDDEPLPLPMGGLAKIRPDSVLTWVTGFTSRSDCYAYYSEKIDGISLLLHYREGKLSAAYKKRNPESGRNVIAFTKYVKDIPQKLVFKGSPRAHISTSKGDVIVRAELAITFDAFEPYSKDALGKDGYSTPRVMVSSIFNRLEVDEETKELLKLVRCVVYDVLFPKPVNCDINRHWIESLFLNPVHGRALPLSDLEDDNIVSLIKETKEESPYPCDGIVIAVSNDEIHRTAVKLHTADQTSKQTTVIRIEVEMSMRNLMKPRIIIDPVVIDGIKVSSLTGNNMRDIDLFKIGPGSIVHACRAGEVIPHLLKTGNFKPSPSKKYALIDKCPDCGGTLTWTVTANGSQGADRICQDVKCLESKRTGIFLERLGVKGLGDAHIDTLSLDRSVSDILDLQEKDFVKLLGKVGTGIYNGIWDAMECPLARIMFATGIFSTGSQSLGVATITTILDMLESNGYTSKQITRSGVSGLNIPEVLAILPPTNTTNLFVNALFEFNAFYRTIEDAHTIPALTKTLAGKVFTFSGFRDPNLQDRIAASGGIYSDALSKKTTHLVYQFGGEPHPVKAEKARKQGCAILSNVELVKIIIGKA